jgi:hypothetical protein
MAGEKATSDTKQGKSHGRRFQGRRPEEGRINIPMLKYGKGNNFFQFQQALYKRALKDYGDLAKLLTLNKYYVPEIQLPDFTSAGASTIEIDLVKTELVKDFAKQVGRMRADRPKLYGLILEYMSVESRDEVAREPDYEVWSIATDPEKLWQAIVRMHKVDCVSNISQVKKLTARKAYQNIRQGAFESLSQYSERFRETYHSYKNTANAATPVDIKEEEQAMDFFHGLDNARYAAFKSNMLNGWAAEAFNPPGTINQIFRIAATWVKPVPRGDGGTAVSYVTLEDDAKGKARKKEQQKKQQAKKQAAATVVVTAADEVTTEEGDQKLPPKDRSNYKCWSCGEKGHLANSKLCPNQKKKNGNGGDGLVNGTWQNEDVEEFNMFATRADTGQQEYTLNNAVNQAAKLKLTEILLDNQADISIVL